MFFWVASFLILVDLSIKELDQCFWSVSEVGGIAVGTVIIIYDVYRLLEISHLGVQLFLQQFLEIIKAFLAWCQRVDVTIDEGIGFLKVGAQNLFEDVVDGLRARATLLIGGNSRCLGDTTILYRRSFTKGTTLISILLVGIFFHLDIFGFENDHAVVRGLNVDILACLILVDGWSYYACNWYLYRFSGNDSVVGSIRNSVHEIKKILTSMVVILL